MQQLVGAPASGRPVEPEQPGHHHQVLAARQLLVDGGELTSDPDQPPHGGPVVGDVVTEDADGAPSGRSSVDSTLINVVLPAPLRPSKATIPPLMSRSSWSSTVTAPKRLVSPRISTAVIVS